MHTALPYPEPRPALSLWAVAERVAPLSDTVVAAVQMFGDVRAEREDGTTLIRFSAARLAREDMRLVLGEAVARAAQVSIVWDEQEEQLLDVLDAAPLIPRARLTALGRPRHPNPYAEARMRGTVRDRLADQAAAA